jgi:16S rRNA C967 or C1407 C5-methylase (RsmB/RsmF family)
VDAIVGDGLATLDPTLGDEWPLFRHRSRREFLQTLPHVHATTGFFVARLQVHA